MRIETDTLRDPEKYFPENFETPEKANAILLGLLQEAADEIDRLRNLIDVNVTLRTRSTYFGHDL
jgi:hypothetical protein